MSEVLTTLQLKEKEKAETKLLKYQKPTLKSASVEHRVAKERMLYILVQEQEKIAHALVMKAKTGDVPAIKEFFDRLYGKPKESIEMSGDVQFSLKALAVQRELLKAREAEVVEEGINAHVSQIDSP